MLFLAISRLLYDLNTESGNISQVIYLTVAHLEIVLICHVDLERVHPCRKKKDDMKKQKIRMFDHDVYIRHRCISCLSSSILQQGCFTVLWPDVSERGLTTVVQGHRTLKELLLFTHERTVPPVTSYLSPLSEYPLPAWRCHSSGWRPCAGSSHSRPSHQPTAATGHRPPSGCNLPLGSHGPLEEETSDVSDERRLGVKRKKGQRGERQTQQHSDNVRIHLLGLNLALVFIFIVFFSTDVGLCSTRRGPDLSRCHIKLLHFVT